MKFLGQSLPSCSIIFSWKEKMFNEQYSPQVRGPILKGENSVVQSASPYLTIEH
jgi:hypothetical protein